MSINWHYYYNVGCSPIEFINLVKYLTANAILFTQNADLLSLHQEVQTRLDDVLHNIPALFKLFYS